MNSHFWSHGYPTIPYCLFNIANGPYAMIKYSCHGDGPVGSALWCSKVRFVFRYDRTVPATMLKNRENSVRTKDKDGYTRRAGCICFKTEQEKEVLANL